MTADVMNNSSILVCARVASPDCLSDLNVRLDPLVVKELHLVFTHDIFLIETAINWYQSVQTV